MNEEMVEIDFIQPKKTVGKLISIDVLDKIRAEIEKLPSELTCDGRRMIRRQRVYDVLDKYKKGEEG